MSWRLAILLSADWPMALAVFALCATGLSLLLMLAGLLVRRTQWTPAPGLWTHRVSQGMAVLLWGSGGWLLWVLMGQISWYMWLFSVGLGVFEALCLGNALSTACWRVVSGVDWCS